MAVAALLATVSLVPLGLIGTQSAEAAPVPATPIQHLVVIADSEVSFDHYFGTYPDAANTDGSSFTPAVGTPAVNGLTSSLLDANPNTYDPERLTHSEALTCDQTHSYRSEQLAFDGGAMDKFEQYDAADTCTGQPVLYGTPGLVMDYYDGNTVTGLWNYAQHYAMSDNNYQTTFGSDTVGALNLASGNTGGGQAVSSTTGVTVSDPGAVGSVDSEGVGTIYSDLDPAFDDCSDSSHTTASPVGDMSGTNIGNLMDAAGVTWGWFQGGFAPTGTANGYAVCGAAHENVGGNEVADYIPHFDPFQYYQSTANPKHLPPSSEAAIGTTDQANHQYDLSDFAETLTDGNMPAVSFLTPSANENGHAGYSDPLDEQTFLVNTINEIEQSEYWPSTAILITYSGSGGWYDHVMGTIVNGSDDSTLDTTMCQDAAVTLGSVNDRCGYGPRVPLLAISPYAPENTVSHVFTDQTSIVRFIEDNWLSGTRIGGGSYDALAGSLDGPGGLLNFATGPHDDQLVLDPASGEVVSDLSLTTTPMPTSASVGASPTVLNDSALLSGGDDPTGTITFTLSRDGGSTPVDTEMATVSGSGSYTTPTGYTVPSGATGTYQWDASYSGDSGNNTISDVDASDEQVIVNRGATSFTVAVNGGSSASTTYGTAAAFSWNGLPSGATGTASFYTSSNTELCSLSLPATRCANSNLGGGTHSGIYAVYSGDGNYSGSDSTNTVTLIVKRANQSIHFSTKPPTDATFGGPRYAPKATATSSRPVTFRVVSSSEKVCAISARKVSFIGVGTCTIEAAQAGDSDYNSAHAVQSFKVNKAPTTISTAPAAITHTGKTTNVTMKATLNSLSSGAPIRGETITFTLFGDGWSITGTAVTNKSGVATFAVSFHKLDSLRSYSASFAGNKDYGSSSASRSI